MADVWKHGTRYSLQRASEKLVRIRDGIVMALQAKSEKFWNLVDRSAEVRKVVSGFGFTEGPVFSRRGYLLFSDIPNNRIHKWERGQLTTVRENSNKANGLTFDHQGRLLAAEGGGRVRRQKERLHHRTRGGRPAGAERSCVLHRWQRLLFRSAEIARVSDYAATERRGRCASERGGSCRGGDCCSQRRRPLAEPAATLCRGYQNKYRQGARYRG